MGPDVCQGGAIGGLRPLGRLDLVAADPDPARLQPAVEEIDVAQEAEDERGGRVSRVASRESMF